MIANSTNTRLNNIVQSEIAVFLKFGTFAWINTEKPYNNIKVPKDKINNKDFWSTFDVPNMLVFDNNIPCNKVPFTKIIHAKTSNIKPLSIYLKILATLNPFLDFLKLWNLIEEIITM